MADVLFDDVDSILTTFQDLDDPRSHINRRHVFGDLLVICIMAVIAGADGPQAIGVWADNNQDWLTRILHPPIVAAIELGCYRASGIWPPFFSFRSVAAQNAPLPHGDFEHAGHDSTRRWARLIATAKSEHDLVK